jgi:hypothetical protein
MCNNEGCVILPARMRIGLTRIATRGTGFPARDDLDAVIIRRWRYKSGCESLSFRILSDAGVPESAATNSIIYCMDKCAILDS